MRFVPLSGLLLLLLSAAPALAAEPALKAYESKYYLLRTDLPEAEAREAKLRITRMAAEYLQRTSGFGGVLKERLPFYLYKNLADYTKAVGVEGSGGYFDGDKLMATTLRTKTGAISADTWHIVQHEGFHQFIHAVTERDIPMWADEGLAEYFGEAIFTGDGFVTGLIPQARLARLRKLLADKEAPPLAEMLAKTREDWNAKVEMKNYDRAWSFVHFLTHGEEGGLAKAFAQFMHDVGQGKDAAKSYAQHLGSIPNLEARYHNWWLKLPDHPTAQGYDRCTLSILTSFLARATAQVQSFADFEELIKTPVARMQQGTADWLPPALFEAAATDATQMQASGSHFALVNALNHPAVIELTLKDGTKLLGRFTLDKAGHIQTVSVEVVTGSVPR